MPEQGITYGPAVSRVTRTPISYGPVNGLEGQYTPPNLLQQFLGNIPIIRNLINSGGNIRIDPSKGDPGLSTRHEQIHRILQPLDQPSLVNPFDQSTQLQKLNASNPYYAAIAAKFNPKYGEANAEIPAYALTGGAEEIGVDNPIDPRYGEYLKNQLFKIDPSIKKKLEKLRSQ